MGEQQHIFSGLTTVLQYRDGAHWQYVTPTQKFSGAFSDGQQIYGITDDQIYIIDSTTLITTAYATHEKRRVATGTRDRLFVWPTGQPPSLYHNGTWTPTATGSYADLVTSSMVGDPVSDGAKVMWRAATDVGDDIIAVGDDLNDQPPSSTHVSTA